MTTNEESFVVIPSGIFCVAFYVGMKPLVVGMSRSSKKNMARVIARSSRIWGSHRSKINDIVSRDIKYYRVVCNVILFIIGYVLC